MKKLIALILAVILAVSLFASCTSNNGGGDAEDTTAGTAESTTGQAVENDTSEIDEYVRELASQYDYSGQTVTIIVNAGKWSEDEELTGNLENDAMYNRSMEVENIFGIDFKCEQLTEPGDFTYIGENVADYVTRDVMAGTGAYDLVESGLLSCGRTLVNNGALLDASTLDVIDLSRSWWSKNIWEQLSINNKLFFLEGKGNAEHYTNSAAILFNKQICSDFSIEEPYQYVYDGTWTYDKMVELSSVIPANSGVYRISIGGAAGGLNYYFGAGYKITEFDSDGIPVIAGSLSAEQVNFIDELATIFGDISTVSNTRMYELNKYDQSYDPEEAVFGNGVVLFDTDGIGSAIELRESEIEFGIVPTPKKDSSQEEYHSFSSAWAGFAFYIPKDVTDPVRSGVIIEAYNALSEKYLEPAYMEKSLKGRSVYDVDSRDMIDIIYNSTIFDLAELYQWGNVVIAVNNAVQGDNSTLVSTYNISAKMATNEIKALVRQLDKE